MKSAQREGELAHFLRTIVGRLGFLPDREYLCQVPVWAKLVAQADYIHSYGFEGFLQEVIPSGFLQTSTVKIPSLEQRLVGARIAHSYQGSDVFLLDGPGTRKTGAALCARAIMEEELLPLENPSQKRVPVFITCPGYIIPLWLREIGKFFPDGHNRAVTITRENRERAIRRASDPNVDFILVGYDMTFRRIENHGKNGQDSYWHADRYVQLMGTLRTKDQAHKKLRELRGDSFVERMVRKNVPLDTLLSFIVDAEWSREYEESDFVIEALRKQVFTGERLYYAIVDEHHNILHPHSKRARAIAEIVRPARWKALISGTGIGNNLEDGLVYASYAAGFVEDPQTFRVLTKIRDPKRVKAFLDIASIHPIRRLKDIDPAVKNPVIVEKPYDFSAEEMEAVVALMNTDLFYGGEKYLLFRYLIANPKKLLPQQFLHLSEEDDSLLTRIRLFFDRHPRLEETIQRAPQSRIIHTKNLVDEIVRMGEKCLVVCEYQSGVTVPLEEALSDYGVCRIDQSISPHMKEFPLTKNERERLSLYKDPHIFQGDEQFRSDLSVQGRKELKIGDHAIYQLSERDCAILTLSTSPTYNVGVTTRVLREGVDLTEITYIIDFEPTTIPSRDVQFIARTVRSGQQRQVNIWRPFCRQLRMDNDERA